MSLPSARPKPDESGASKAGGGAVVSGAVPTAREVDPMIGRVLDGRFTIESRLGAGSMGTVYKAKQHAMGRNVAIKILRSDRALDEGARARFLREARANSLLASPHTVTVFDFGQADNGDFFLAMELLEGESLGDRLKRDKRIAPEAAVDAVRQALRSLAEAHAKGIIHRDLKPDNLFFAKVLTTDEGGARKHDEAVKVVDFGIAKMLGSDNAPMNAIETQAGTVFGTPRYMSPEQAQGKVLDARSDLYSLGVILYQMLTGRPPFTDDDAIVVMARHIKTPPKRLIEAAPHAGIPQELENVVMRALAKEPPQRPASAEALSQELARAMNFSAVATSGIRTSLAPSATASANVRALAALAALPAPVPSVPVPSRPVPPAPGSEGSLTSSPLVDGKPADRRRRTPSEAALGHRGGRDAPRARRAGRRRVRQRGADETGRERSARLDGHDDARHRPLGHDSSFPARRAREHSRAGLDDPLHLVRRPATRHPARRTGARPALARGPALPSGPLRTKTRVRTRARQTGADPHGDRQRALRPLRISQLTA